MKQRYSVLTALLCAAALLLSCAPGALADRAGDWDYTVSGGAATVTAYSGPGGDVAIPDTLGGVPVTAIGGGVFTEGELTSVAIPEGVTVIARDAFLYCEKLAAVAIPAGIAVIGIGAFESCTALTDVYYGGTADGWSRVEIGAGNEPLHAAAIHYGGETSQSADFVAVRSPQNLMVDGVYRDVEKYNIDGSNYFMLRDVAWLLRDTAKRFSVDYDEASRTVRIVTGETYAPDGSEMIVGEDKSGSAVKSSQAISINGVLHEGLAVYNLGGHNYFKLRDLGAVLGFAVDYEKETNTAVIRSA